MNYPSILTPTLVLALIGTLVLATGCDSGVSSLDLEDASNGSRALLHARPGAPLPPYR